MTRYQARLYSALGLSIAMAQGAAAYAQEPPADAQVQSGDIIVTARRREETSMSVPVQITAVAAEELQRRGVTRLDDLNAMVPQLQFGESAGGAQGGTITLRGTGAGEGSVLVDQAVSFVIDGAPVARSSVRRMSELDIQSIEVLKGPQALFYGKNSPGGIIAIRTADPGSSLQVGANAAYEFEADEIRGDAFISSPLTDSLGIRVAVYGSRMSGDKEETISPTSPLAPDHRGRPYDREYGGRLTLKFDPGSDFNARFKFNYGHTDTAGLAENAQFIFCPTGTQQYGDPGIACKPSGNIYSPQNPASLAARDYRFRDGQLYLSQRQILTSLEMNLHPVDAFTISSLTSYYDAKIHYADNVTKSVVVLLPASADIGIKDFSHEVRLTSDLTGPFNFMLGALYGYSDSFANNTAFLISPTSTSLLGRLETRLKGESYSFFGQASWKIFDTLELAGGGRYSHENKRVVYYGGRDPGVYDIFLPTPVPSRNFHDFSPEATLTYRPSQQFTIFGAYKQGYLSGGFNTAIGAVNVDRSYDLQKTKGFEAGLKARMFDNAVRLNLGIYDYTTKGLQLTIVFVDSSGNNIAQVLNVGKSVSKGVEGDIDWRTPIEGFSLRGGFGYNHARYDRFNTNCYRGQTIGLGCNQAPNASGVFTLQNMKGAQIVRAPDWVVNGGAALERPIGSDLKFGLSGDASYTSSFFTTVQNIPGSLQKAYWLLDATARIGSKDERWELALIGKNLTNTYYFTRVSEAPTQGTTPGTATGRLADLLASVSRGRQIMLRGTVRF